MNIPVPIKAVDWFLANHRWVRRELDSVLFVIRAAPLLGLGGRTGGTGNIPPDPEGDYVTTKETYMYVLDSIEAALASLSEYQQTVCVYKTINIGRSVRRSFTAGIVAGLESEPWNGPSAKSGIRSYHVWLKMGLMLRLFKG